ncbi:hypothetical protein SASPL_115428 [Salvia splendens]|uniref:Uncharacterized protein n=1 Tax=Salvia splendens TaxID=180675 RepID=A0A8X8Y3R0_SALSN|nr:hypothetical protein SASPL_115428 [Salvia splendens]
MLVMPLFEGAGLVVFDQKLQVLCKQSISCALVLNVAYAVSNVIQMTQPESKVQNRDTLRLLSSIN